MSTTSRLFLGGLILAVITVGLAGCPQSNDVEVPDLSGKSQTDAQATIEAVGLNVGTVSQEPSATVPAGNVISQIPTAGINVSKGTAVNLVVSNGPQTVAIPNVVGMTQAAAQTTITNAGLTVGTVSQQSNSTVPVGCVITQNPPAGTGVAPGSGVNLLVSIGAPVTVPNVVGMTAAAANSAIAGAGLTAGTVTQAYDLTILAGNVVRQDPQAGTNVAPGTPVNLVVSKGPLMVPNLVGMLQTDADTVIAGLGLAVGVVSQQYSATVPIDAVISQDPPAGTHVIVGTAVSLVLSKGAGPVPNVVEKDQGDAQVLITAVGLTVGVVGEEYSTTVPVGKVISQNPDAGSTVAQGTPVNFVVSKGPQPVSVPNVVGKTRTDAQTMITGVGLTVGTVTFQFSDTVLAGSVISQTPTEGTSVLPGTAVALVLSTGPQPVKVPNIVGKLQSSAEASITNADLVVGTVSQEYSSTIPNGQVISQDPPAGTNVAPNTPVDFITSKGPQPVSVPNVMGKTRSDAQTTITGVGLTVGTVTFEFSDTVLAGNVISQDPSPDSKVPPNSPVNLVVSQGSPIAVPNVVGKPQADAQTSITAVGLTVGTVTQVYAPVTVGQIVSQTPQPGTNVLLGTKVNLVVSKGAGPVPNVVGTAQSGAQKSITAVGLTVGMVTQAFSATVPLGFVISQTPASGATVPPGTAVDLVVSKGAFPIASISELQRIGNDTAYPLNGNYVLSQDIDASATATWNNGDGFLPIGSSSNPYMGTFDGQGHVISALRISPESTNPDVGLFSYVGDKGTVKNITLDGCNVSVTVTEPMHIGALVGNNEGTVSGCAVGGTVSTNSGYTGGLVGINEGTVTECNGEVTVSGEATAGGLVGFNYGGTITLCYTQGPVAGTQTHGGYYGGLTGWNYLGSVINQCHATGTVSAGPSTACGGLTGLNDGTLEESYATGAVSQTGTGVGGPVGGLVGLNNSGTVTQCYATGTVTITATIPESGYVCAGGLTGQNSGAVSQCYATGAVSTAVLGSSRVYIGGLVGPNGGTISQCYAVGAVSVTGQGSDHHGGLAGNNFGTVSTSYWDTETSEQTTSAGGTGKSTVEMMTSATFVGWSFTNTWDIHEGNSYPFLRSVP